jgi:hypothetical protein
MINFRLGTFLDGLNYLQHELRNAKGAPPDTLVPEDQHSRVKGTIEIVIKACAGDLRIEEARHTWHKLEELFNIYGKQKYTHRALADLLQRLYDDIQRGALQQYFFHYPTNLVPLVMPSFEGGDVPTEWNSIASAFKSSKPEIQAGIDCYAFGDYPGCVFHMMRIAELGLRTIAGERGVRHLGKKKPKPIEWGTWQEVFDAIESQLKVVRQAPQGPKRDLAISFYDTALSDLRTLRGLYRDPTMHFRDNYDKGEAYSAIFRVQSLMRMLSSKLREDHTRKIAWGL